MPWAISHTQPLAEESGSGAGAFACGQGMEWPFASRHGDVFASAPLAASTAIDIAETPSRHVLSIIIPLIGSC